MASSAGDSAGQLAILHVGRVLVEAAVPTGEVGNISEWIEKLVVVQACVLETVAARGQESVVLKAVRIVKGGLKSRPQVLPVYLDVLAAENKSGDCLVALSAVAVYSRALPLFDGESIQSEIHHVVQLFPSRVGQVAD